MICDDIICELWLIREKLREKKECNEENEKIKKERKKEMI